MSSATALGTMASEVVGWDEEFILWQGSDPSCADAEWAETCVVFKDVDGLDCRGSLWVCGPPDREDRNNSYYVFAGLEQILHVADEILRVAARDRNSVPRTELVADGAGDRLLISRSGSVAALVVQRSAVDRPAATLEIPVKDLFDVAVRMRATAMWLADRPST